MLRSYAPGALIPSRWATRVATSGTGIQSIWSMQVVEDRQAGRPWRHSGELTAEERRQRWAASLNSCHVWDETGEFAQHALGGGTIDVPIPLRRRFDALGIDPFALGDGQ